MVTSKFAKQHGVTAYCYVIWRRRYLPFPVEWTHNLHGHCVSLKTCPPTYHPPDTRTEMCQKRDIRQFHSMTSAAVASDTDGTERPMLRRIEPLRGAVTYIITANRMTPSGELLTYQNGLLLPLLIQARPPQKNSDKIFAALTPARRPCPTLQT